MDRKKLALLAFAVPACALTAAAPAHAGDAAVLHADLAEVNDSGAAGTAKVTVEGTRVTVRIETSGLLADAPHAQHFHIGGKYMCAPPEAADDITDDGRLSTTEGAPYYGPVKVSLTTEGDTSPASSLAVDRMPVADAHGTVSYHRTFTVSEDVAAAIRAGKAVIEQHGVDYNGNGLYDFEAAGKSDLDPSLPAEATNPAACGELTPVPKGGMAAGAGGAAATGPNAGMLATGMVLAAAVGGGLAARRRFGESA
ncbi:CHRD domain-containing protein [Thermobifida halotolerans]|uniref:CHRD domain-containing protein n=1 Tax=Thermobifida halotolerans TaxID=483545 RepID=A0A399G6S0_9ACTN|nr:CHRD domain-containing protein [Thermobifida halotolerans]UOE20720.1 CHRD domain-containing protein [Thermobifida halotolerans]